MEDIDTCIGRECKILDRGRVGPYRRRRRKESLSGGHCPIDQEAAEEHFDED